MPVLDMLPIAYFVNGDNGQKKTTKQAWIRNLSLPKRLQLLFRFRKQSWMIPVRHLGRVKPRVTEAFGKVIDSAVLFGENKPSTWRDDGCNRNKGKCCYHIRRLTVCMTRSWQKTGDCTR